MSLKSAITMGVVGAAGIFVLRKFLPPVEKIVDATGANPMRFTLPMDPLAPIQPGGFGLQYALIPAAVGYYLSR